MIFEEPCPSVPDEASEALPVVIAATFAVDALAEPLRIWAELVVGIRANFTWVGYGEAISALMCTDSVLCQNVSGVNVVLARLEDLCEKPLMTSTVARDERSDFASEAVNSDGTHQSWRKAAKILASSVRNCSSVCAQPLLLILPPGKPPEEHPSSMHSEPATDQIEWLQEALSCCPNVHIFSSNELCGLYAWMGSEYYCSFLDRAAHAPYSLPMLSALAGFIVRHLARVSVPARKLAVLDCDGTLWGGAVGELGVEGVLLSEPFLAVQRFFVRLQQRGWLLCLCSRNVEDDVLAVFKCRAQEMPLQLEHIVGIKANWLPKSQNVCALAQDLCLGLDSLVFVDDNPAECADVQANCPGVAVLQVPAQEEGMPAFLENAWVLDSPLSASGGQKSKSTNEDTNRSELYRALFARRKEQANFATQDAFLASLNLQVHIERLSQATVERAAQLTSRTNQHNARKCVLSASQLLACASAGMQILTFESSDRFGHHGLVGLVIIDGAPVACSSLNSTVAADSTTPDDVEFVAEPPSGGSLTIRTWLLSCRTLHLGIEHRMMRQVATIASDEKVAWLAIDWVLAERNEPAAAFLFSLPGVCFLPCVRPPLNSFSGLDSKPTTPTDLPVQSTAADVDGETHRGIQKIEGVGFLEGSAHEISANQVADRVEAVFRSAEAQGFALTSSCLPSEAAVAQLSRQVRRDICKKLLPVARRLQAPDDNAPSAVQLLRGRIGGERCVFDVRQQQCLQWDCPFQHAQSTVRNQPGIKESSTSVLRESQSVEKSAQNSAPSTQIYVRSQAAANKPQASSSPDGIPGVSVYQCKIRPRSGIIYVPVESALVADVSFGSAESQARTGNIGLGSAAAEDTTDLIEKAGTDRRVFKCSSGIALHNDTYNYIARMMFDVQSQVTFHEWLVGQQREGRAMPAHYREVWQRICEEDSKQLTGPDADRQHAKLRREIRHAQHLMMQENNPDSYYNAVEHHMT